MNNIKTATGSSRQHQTLWGVHAQGLSFIALLRTAAVSYNTRESAGTRRGSHCAQDPLRNYMTHTTRVARFSQ